MLKLGKRLPSLLLALVLVLSMTTVAFAKDFDLINKNTRKPNDFFDLIDDQSFFFNVLDNTEQYVIEVDGKYYEVADVNAATKAEDKEIEEVVKDLEPVDLDVEEELEVVEVSAINGTQAEVKFNKEVEEVKPANFKVTDKDGNLVFVSQVTLNEAKDVATLTFFDKFVDKGVYTVEVSNVADVDGNVMEKATAKFEYVKADVAKVEFAATTIAPGKNVKDLVKVTDKLGRDVTDEVEIEFESSALGVIDTNGDVKSDTDKKSAIVVAKVKVGDDYVKSTPTTIKVQAKEANEFVGYYVYKNAAKGNTDEFLKLKDEEKVDYVYEDDKGHSAKKLALYYKDQYGNSMDVAKADDVQITNLTPNIVIVEKSNDVLNIKPIYPGEGYVKIKVGEVEHTIKIVVREEAKVATMELDKTDVSVVAEKAGEIVKVAFKDQFDNEIPPAEELKAEVKDDKVAKATVADDKKSITIKGLKEGATTVEVTYKDEDNKIDLKETINVTVAKAGELAKYEAEVDATKLDVDGYEANAEEADKKDKLPKSTVVVVYEIDANGNKLGKAKNVTLKEVDKDGKAVAAGKELLDANQLKNETVEAAKPGTAYVQVSVGSLVIDTLEFEVVNTKSVATSVDFDRQDIVFDDVTVKEDGTVENDGLLDIKAELKNIIKVLDQDGNVMKGTDGEDKKVNVNNITIETTNAKGLEVSDNKITKITSANPTVDVVVTEVKEGEENLLKAPTTIKVAVKVEEQEGNVKATARTVNGDNEDVNPLGSVIIQLDWAEANITNADIEALEIEIYNDEKLLATNILQPEKLESKALEKEKIDSPFNLGRSEKHSKWAWVRGEYPLQGETVTVDDLPNKVVATYVINGITYVSEIELTGTLEVPTVYQAEEETTEAED